MLENGRSVVGDDNFSSSSLDLFQSASHRAFFVVQHTILSIPLGPKLVRTASETAALSVQIQHR